MKLSIARVSVSSRRPQTCSSIAFRAMAFPSWSTRYRSRLAALRVEVDAQPFREVLLVCDDEDALRHPRGHQAEAGAAGSCSVNVLPWPCPALSAKALPPCFLATDRTMKSPRPLPFVRTATLAGIR